MEDISVPVLALKYVFHLCKIAIKEDISEIPTSKHHSQKQSLTVCPSISTTYTNHKTHREGYCSW